MKVLRFHLRGIFLLMVGTCVAGVAIAAEPVPITANAAFDAFATQTDPRDPQMGMVKKVALVDVRSRAEYFWVGTATKVDEILLKNGSTIVPDLGKVILKRTRKFGKFLTFKLNGRKMRVLVKEVSSIKHSPIAINIPFKFWDETTGKLEKDPNPNFQTDIEALAGENKDVVLIVYCRTGGRSTSCSSDFDTTKFFAVYEIDDPMGMPGYGGFEGSSYKNVYNGYLGFPSRQTRIQEVRSVSWKDSGLPMKTLINPLE
jgi:rhodanese-related sulfurtransferase